MTGLVGARSYAHPGSAALRGYAIFHRHHALHWLKRVGGRFRRSDLHELVWSERSEAEQRLFLSFMESCALCFCLSKRQEDDPEYVAPALLPDQATYAEEVALRRQERGEETVWYTYTQRFIHRSVMQRFMVRVGQMFRTRAVYWKDGVCIDVPETQSMAIIDCERGVGGNPAQGRMTIEVRGRARHDLLNRLRNECERLIPHHQEIWQAVSVDGAEWVDVAKLPDARLLGSVVSDAAASTRRPAVSLSLIQGAARRSQPDGSLPHRGAPDAASPGDHLYLVRLG